MNDSRALRRWFLLAAAFLIPTLFGHAVFPAAPTAPSAAGGKLEVTYYFLPG